MSRVTSPIPVRREPTTVIRMQRATRLQVMHLGASVTKIITTMEMEHIALRDVLFTTVKMEERVLFRQWETFADVREVSMVIDVN